MKLPSGSFAAVVSKGDRGRRLRGQKVVGYLLVVCGVIAVAAANASAADEVVVTREKWEVLFQAKRKAGQSPLPETLAIKNLADLKLTGGYRQDPFHLGKYAINGEFGINQGLLSRIAGNNAAIELASDLEDFELEALMQANGLGGWYWLFGWNDGHGYAVYNPTLKTSGSPWIISEFRGAIGIADTVKELNRWEWKGPQTLRLSVVASKLNLQVGNVSLARDVAVPNFHKGSLIVGSYDTPYGPRQLQFQNIKLRRVTVKMKDPEVEK